MCSFLSSKLQSRCVVASPIDAPHPTLDASVLITQVGRPWSMIRQTVGRDATHQRRSRLPDRDKDIRESKCPLELFKAMSLSRSRLPFSHAKLDFRLYVNSAVIPRKISNNVSLHEVLERINSKWRTNLC